MALIERKSDQRSWSGRVDDLLAFLRLAQELVTDALEPGEAPRAQRTRVRVELRRADEEVSCSSLDEVEHELGRDTQGVKSVSVRIGPTLTPPTNLDVSAEFSKDLDFRPLLRVAGGDRVRVDGAFAALDRKLRERQRELRAIRRAIPVLFGIGVGCLIVSLTARKSSHATADITTLVAVAFYAAAGLGTAVLWAFPRWELIGPSESFRRMRVWRAVRWWMAVFLGIVGGVIVTLVLSN